VPGALPLAATRKVLGTASGTISTSNATVGTLNTSQSVLLELSRAVEVSRLRAEPLPPMRSSIDIRSTRDLLEEFLTRSEQPRSLCTQRQKAEITNEWRWQCAIAPTPTVAVKTGSLPS
jgi:hypothetical protein